MTNNQREFQKEINRIQRELAQLQKQHHFKHPIPIPQQPKRITSSTLNKLRKTTAEDLILSSESPSKNPTTKTTRSSITEPYQHKTRTPSTDVYIRHPRLKHEHEKKPKTKSTLTDLEAKTRKVRSDKGIKRRTPSPLKGRKRGTLSPEERERRNAKRIETLSKSNKPRKTRKDKGIKRGSRTTTPTHQDYPAFSPAEAIIDRLRNADMLNKLNQGNSELNTFCDALESRYHYSYNTISKTVSDVEDKRLERTNYFYNLISIVETNANNADYNELLKQRQEDIETAISGIIYNSDGSYLASDSQADYCYNKLLSLLSTAEPTLEEKKALNEQTEQFMDADFDWSYISEQ